MPGTRPMSATGNTTAVLLGGGCCSPPQGPAAEGTRHARQTVDRARQEAGVEVPRLEHTVFRGDMEALTCILTHTGKR